MTLVSDIIADAYRRSNIIAAGASVSTAQAADGLRFLNRLVKSVFGNEVGEKLEAFPIGRKNIQRPAGYPWYNTQPDNNFFFPPNVRAVFNLEDNTQLQMYLTPEPSPGSRFAYNWMNPGNGATVTLHGNGRFIAGAESIVIDGTTVEADYLYRDDLAQWVKYAPLLAGDTFPFPEEFDNFFILMLALDINPAYGVTLDAQAQRMLSRSQQQIRARYHQHIPTRSELGLIRNTRTAADRDRWGSMYWLYNPTDMFSKGWPQ